MSGLSANMNNISERLFQDINFYESCHILAATNRIPVLPVPAGKNISYEDTRDSTYILQIGMIGTENLEIRPGGTPLINGNRMFGPYPNTVSRLDNLVIPAPMILAGDKITLIAERTIEVGKTIANSAIQGPAPAYICAKSRFEARAPLIEIARANLPLIPNEGYLDCQKLTICSPRNPTDEITNQIEIVLSWVDDAAEVEIIRV